MSSQNGDARAEASRPGVATRVRGMRWKVTEAVRASTLLPLRRLIMLTLADVAEVTTAEIPEKFTPSLNTLAKETGLDKSTVTRHLNALEEAGWLERLRPDKKAQWYGAQTRYRLTIPSGQPHLGVGAEGTYVGAEDNHPGCTEHLGVGAENAGGSCTGQLLDTDLPDLEQIKDHPSAAERPGEVVQGELVDATPHLPALVADPENAGQINRAWIDYCTANEVKLTTSLIKRYGAGIKQALADGFSADLIKRALAQMLADRVASRPALFDTYLVRAQQGPELPPRRASRTEEAAARLTPQGISPEQHLYDTLTRPA